MSQLREALRQLALQVGARLSSEVKSSLSPLGPYLRQLAIGVTLILVSTLGWFCVLLFLLVAFFCSLSGLGGYVAPALWSSLVSFLASLPLLLLGISLVRKPR